MLGMPRVILNTAIKGDWCRWVMHRLPPISFAIECNQSAMVSPSSRRCHVTAVAAIGAMIRRRLFIATSAPSSVKRAPFVNEDRSRGNRSGWSSAERSALGRIADLLPLINHNPITTDGWHRSNPRNPVRPDWINELFYALKEDV